MVNRCPLTGLNDKTLIESSSRLVSMSMEPTTSEMSKSLPSTFSERLPRHARSEQRFTLSCYMITLQYDLIMDICGENKALSCLNYMQILARFYELFQQIERKLHGYQSLEWIQPHQGSSKFADPRRPSLTMLALKGLNRRCHSGGIPGPATLRYELFVLGFLTGRICSVRAVQIRGLYSFRARFLENALNRVKLLFVSQLSKPDYSETGPHILSLSATPSYWYRD